MKNQIRKSGTGRVTSYLNYKVYRALVVAEKKFSEYIVNKMLYGNSLETEISFNHYCSQVQTAVTCFRCSNLKQHDWHDLCMMTLGFVIK